MPISRCWVGPRKSRCAKGATGGSSATASRTNPATKLTVRQVLQARAGFRRRARRTSSR